MIDLRYSLTIEATEEPDFFSFYSPDLEGFSGVGQSIEDCIYKAKWGMLDHVRLLELQFRRVFASDYALVVVDEFGEAVEQGGFP